jgi:hypothetical protein
VQDGAPAHARGIRDACRERDRGFADKAQQREQFPERVYHLATDAFEHRAGRGPDGRRIRVLRDELEQSCESGRPAAQVRLGALAAKPLQKPLEDPHADAVERLDTRAVDGDLRPDLRPTCNGKGVELPIERADAERGPAPR